MATSTHGVPRGTDSGRVPDRVVDDVDEFSSSEVPWGGRVSRSDGQGELPAAGHGVDRRDPAGAGDDRAHDGVEAHRLAPDDRCRGDGNVGARPDEG